MFKATVSCGDIITESDGDDSGLWCVPTKTTTKPSLSVHSHEAFANGMGLVISVVWYLQADISVIMHLTGKEKQRKRRKWIITINNNN